MSIQITRVMPIRRRHKPGGGSTLDKAHVRAYVDGHLVTSRANGEWVCKCGDDYCNHIDRIVELIDPEILDQIDGGEQ